MEKQIKLSTGLTFPAAEFACEVSASIGNRGGGKSNGTAVEFMSKTGGRNA